MAVKTLTIDGKLVSAREDETILAAAHEAGIPIPTLCHLDGISDVGACRLCLVEIAGSNKFQPACVTNVAEGMQVTTDSPHLREYRKMIVELLFTERNHVCAVCVAHAMPRRRTERLHLASESRWPAQADAQRTGESTWRGNTLGIMAV